MGKLIFDCGCEFHIEGTDEEIHGDSHQGQLPTGIDVDIYNIPHDCPKTWALLSDGRTKGVFQLEGHLGKTWAMKVQPENLEELSALVALIRPGCVSGDTKITRRMGSNREGRNNNFMKVTMRELYEQFHAKHHSYKNDIMSLDEETNTLIDNEITDVIYSGRKEVFRPLFRCVDRKYKLDGKFHNLECTNDHPLLTTDGWKELKDVKVGDRVAVITTIKQDRSNTKHSKGEKHFRSRCFQNYKYECVMCDWDEGSLDVNHLEGNRKINNHPDNLCYMCPNHHRLYSENKIDINDAIANRRTLKLHNTEHIQWAEYAGKKSLGVTDTYDITVGDPNHNFIAGNVVVHNCLRAMSKPYVSFNRGIMLEFCDEEGEDNGVRKNVFANEKQEILHHKSNRRGGTILTFPEGIVTVDDEDLTLFPAKSMTQHYKDRKHRLEDVEYLDKSLEPILGSTYGVLVFQEQSMKIAITLAGFNLQEADVLRKAIGKKKADIMAQVKKGFLTGCEEVAMVSKEQAEEIFSWIQESQRYSFNKSHAISYGEGGYWTAYLKAHFPAQFYCSYLHGAQWKQDTAEEVYELVNDAKLSDIIVRVPDFRHQRDVPYVRDNQIYFGIGDVKNIGAAALRKVREKSVAGVNKSNKPVDTWTWLDYLFLFSNDVPSTVNEAIISCGGLDYLQKSRTSMLYELDLWSKLTKKEKEWCLTKNDEKPFPNLLSALTVCGVIKKEGGGCHNVKRVKIIGDIANMLANPPHALHDTADFLAWCEEKHLGAALTCSKVDGCEKAVEANATCREVIQGLTGYTVLAVEITRVKEVKTKRGKNPGQKMAFIGMSDSSCSIDDVVIFPKNWREYNGLIHEGNTVLVQGEKGPKKGDSFAVKKVWQI